MSFSTQWDTREFKNCFWPYDRITNELQDEPVRLIRGNNTYVTVGGKLAKRPGTIELTGSTNSNRVSRLWLYETLEKPSKIYVLGSVLNNATGKYRMEYLRLDAAVPAWTSLGSLRDVDASVYPHEVVMSRGRAYIKSFPDAAGDKLGSVVFDGSGGTVTVTTWGVMPPTEPAHVKGAVTRLSAAIDSSTTAVNVVSGTGFPAPNFTIVVEFEEMTVTSIGGGTNWTVTRGVNGTTATSHPDNAIVLYRNFAASDHRVDVNLFWQYAYGYKTLSDHYSSRSPIESNPDKLPSRTGPFTDLKPVMTLTGTADTTNVPTIAVYRSTDGGGSLFLLEEVANPGAGSFDYTDDSLESGTGGGTFNDPLPDEFLDTALRAPSEDSNNPPPTVTAPEVVGTDAVKRSSPMESYAGRIWFGVDNVLFFSGEEEVSVGIPEESWFYGTNGNFFRLPTTVVNLKATDDALYVFTLAATYAVTGTNLATFNIRPLFDNVGAPSGHPGSIVRFGKKIALLTHDFRIVLIEADEYRSISDPLFTDIVDATNDGGRIELAFFGDLEKEWLIVTSQRDDDPRLSQQWIYDLKISQMMRTDFWNVPWTIRSSAMLSGRIFEGQSQRRLVFFAWDPSAGSGRLVRIDPTVRTGQDIWGDGTANGYDTDFVTSLFRVPSGDHVNALREPEAVPVAYSIVTERLVFTGLSNLPDSPPSVYYFWDDLWNEPRSTPPAEDPARRLPSNGYITEVYPLNEVGQRIAVEMLKRNTRDLFQLCNLRVVFAPNSGE